MKRLLAESVFCGYSAGFLWAIAAVARPTRFERLCAILLLVALACAVVWLLPKRKRSNR